MPNQHAPTTDKLLKEALGFYTAAAGNVTRAAKLAGLTRSTFKDRLGYARAKFGAGAITTPDGGILQRAKEVDELGQLRKEVVLLRQHLAQRAAAPKPKPLPRVTKRSGKDDVVRVVIPDTHGSHIDPVAWAAALADIKALNPDELVHLGDYMDCGGFLSAKHVIGHVAQMDEVSYESDMEAWRTQLDQLTAAAPRAKLHLLEGNHLSRVERWAVEASLGNGRNADFLRRAISPEFRLDYAGRGIRYAKDGDFHDGLSSRGTIRLGKCFFTHGFAVGRNAAANHAAKIGGPVVYGHTHTPASFFSKTVKNGVHAAWTPGCLCKFAQRYMHTNPDSWGHGIIVQIVARSGHFITLHVPILNGESLLPAAWKTAQ